MVLPAAFGFQQVGCECLPTALPFAPESLGSSFVAVNLLDVLLERGDALHTTFSLDGGLRL